MQVVDVMAQCTEINFKPANETEEILQNVRTILTTTKYSVPLDRNFGLNADVLDMPLHIMRARLTAEIINAIHRYEPRVKVKKIFYQADAQDGIVKPIVRVVIK